MDLDKLYREKGELLTTIEIAQAKLQMVNQQIVDVINKSTKNGHKEQEKEVVVEQ